jgi:DNA-binding response OmpR family regulator
MKPIASVLAIDDETHILDIIKEALESEGYQVLTAHNGLQALALLESQPVDLILADINMPHMNGYQLYARVSENPQWVMIPFLFLTGRGQESDIRYGKELGVDDYLIKPFQLADLLAAVRGKLQRAQQLMLAYAQHTKRPPDEPELLVLGQLRIDRDQYRVRLNGRSIELSSREFRLLEFLARRARKVAPLEELIQVTHDLSTDRTDASGLLRPLIRSLRRKLGYPAGELGFIQSVRGVGYRLIPPDEPMKGPGDPSS